MEPQEKVKKTRKTPVKKVVIPPEPIIDTDYDNPWHFKGNLFNSTNIDNAYGFVYVIEEISSGRIYIGQKMFWGSKTRMVNKKKKKIKIESDWKNYFSSSAYIKEKIEREGHGDFKRYIVALCISTGQMNYVEIKLQMDLKVLEYPEKYINGFVGGKITNSHIKFHLIKDVDVDLLNTMYSKSYFGFYNDHT